MSVHTDPHLARPLRRSRHEPFLRRVPVIGAIARELAEGDSDFPFYLLLAAGSAWACAAIVWGLPALVIPAVALAPAVMVILIALTLG
jgi:hypothetical protein